MKQHGTASLSAEKTDPLKSHDERPDWHPYKVWEQQIKAKQGALPAEEPESAPALAEVPLHLTTADTGAWKLPQFQVPGTE